MARPLIVIPARLGATRLPRKPLADIAGEPMIVHVWRRAMEADCGDVLVATDAPEIAAAIETAGGKAVMTRTDHPSGSDRVFEAGQNHRPGRADRASSSTCRATCRSWSRPDPRHDRPARRSGGGHRYAWRRSSRSRRRHRAELREDDRHARCRPQYSSARFTLPARPRPSAPGRSFTISAFTPIAATALARFVNLPPSPLELREKLEQLRALEAGMRIDVKCVDSVPMSVDTPTIWRRCAPISALALN